MKNTTANSRQLDIIGNGSCPSAQEILTARLKQCRQKLGYFSVFATLPALLFPNIHEARTEEVKRTEASVAGKTARSLERLNARKTFDLLKRQSKFRLPHQMGSSEGLAPLGGNDDCPGRAIPGGTYTAAAPYIDSGNTTGANDTVTILPSFYYYYYAYNAHGPDHVYSFTLTGRGPNAQIEVSTTSGTYRPLVYVVESGATNSCQAAAGNHQVWTMYDTRWGSSNSSTATLGIDFLPLNVPLHLFIDSAENDARGSGPYTVRMQNVTIAPTAPRNPIEGTEFFVRQHYLDFLSREADPDGLAFWTNQITSCGGDQACIEVKRINDSGSFFLSIEFQETGYLAYRMYKAAYGDLPNAPVPIKLSEFRPDTQQLGKGVIVRQAGWEQVLENNKQTFAVDFVLRSRFTSTYPTSMTPDAFVDTLFANAGVLPASTERTAAINEFGGFSTTTDVAARARVLRRVTENSTLKQQEFNRAFVLMQYFGYLQRNPNDAPDGNFDGYNFWLNKLNRFNGDFIGAEMVKAFLSSSEYWRRFGQP
jgi:hypothetical protein